MKIRNNEENQKQRGKLETTRKIRNNDENQKKKKQKRKFYTKDKIGNQKQ